ncbi:hypothetical protein SOVF_133010 [Spinacia oleracea]|uniref:U-box domain-containing protein 35 n=1 Tax=Spinacia oleracea TaxID=3562 RepID=A0A9R0K7D6_SPIOL|nr:U-box domain-containing protein 35 [Spinacia oleracea]KNA11628.1 hypothetical protein SOVF_133010 [Spinacia oleracea]
MEITELPSPGGSPTPSNDNIHNATASAEYHHYTRLDSRSNNNNNDGTSPAVSAVADDNDYFGGVSEIVEIMEEEEEFLIASSSSSQHNNKSKSFTGKSRGHQLTPISEGGITTNTTSLFSIDIHNNNNNNNNSGRSSDDVVYVAVGKSDSSSEALVWTLKHSVHPGTSLVYLIHIFPDLKFIPSPFGGGVVPKTQVSPDLVERYLAEDTRKRRELLTKYVDICTSHRVQVETILIESDSVANAIVELISVLNIRQLIVGISKSNLRKLKAGKGSATVADQLRRSATDEGCELTIVCQGKKMNPSEYYRSTEDNLHSRSNSDASSSGGDPQIDKQQPPMSYNSFACCFKG